MILKLYSAFLAVCAMLLLAMSLAPMPMVRIWEIVANPTLWNILILLTAPIWLAGAVALFWRKEWSWYASVFGVASMFVQSVVLSVCAYVLIPLGGDPTDGIGYRFITGCFGVVLSLPLLIGLFRRHTELIKGTRETISTTTRSTTII